jgi:uncharacterized peroxidase-related enzyme
VSFIETIRARDATGVVRAMYERQQRAWGYVPNYAKAFSHRPEVLAAWADLIAVIRAPVDRRTFELVTFTAANALGSSSCSLAHGKLLSENHLSADDVAAIADERDEAAALTAAERAMLRFARQLIRDSSAVTQAHIDAMRECGIDDARIVDVACIAAGRAFFANFVEALGCAPDPALAEMDAELAKRLTVGRPVDSEPPERIDESASAA